MGALLGLARPATADVIELKTGQRVEGSFKGADQTAVRIEIGGQVLTFKPEQVRAIYYGAAPAVASGSSSVAQAAMWALKGLQSVTTGAASLTYEQYAVRVLDAKVVVDRYLETPEARGGARDKVSEAMHFSALATNVENRRRRMGTEVTEIAPDKAVEACPQMQQFMKSHKLRDGVTVLWTMDVMPVIWSCASEKIAEAERLMGATGK